MTTIFPYHQGRSTAPVAGPDGVLWHKHTVLSSGTRKLSKGEDDCDHTVEAAGEIDGH